MGLWSVTSDLLPGVEDIFSSYESAWDSACADADRNPGVTFYVRRDGLVLAAVCMSVDGREAF